MERGSGSGVDCLGLLLRERRTSSPKCKVVVSCRVVSCYVLGARDRAQIEATTQAPDQAVAYYTCNDATSAYGHALGGVVSWPVSHAQNETPQEHKQEPENSTTQHSTAQKCDERDTKVTRMRWDIARAAGSPPFHNRPHRRRDTSLALPFLSFPFLALPCPAASPQRGP